MKNRDHKQTLQHWRWLVKNLVAATIRLAHGVVNLMAMLVRSPTMVASVVPGVLVNNLCALQKGRYLTAKQKEGYQVGPDQCQHENGFRKYGAQYKKKGTKTIKICDLCGCRYLRTSAKDERPEQWALISPRATPAPKKNPKKKSDSAEVASRTRASSHSWVPSAPGYPVSSPQELRGASPVAVNLSRGPQVPLVGGLPTESAAPMCPVNPSHPMVVRINATYGTLFWGCSQYPECRGVRDIPAAYQPTVVQHGPQPAQGPLRAAGPGALSSHASESRMTSTSGSWMAVGATEVNVSEGAASAVPVSDASSATTLEAGSD